MVKKLKDISRSVKRAHKKRDNGKKHFRPTGVAVVVSKRGVLFVQSGRTKHWGPPKGGVDKEDNNCIIAAAVRELGEETGLLCKHLRKKRTYLGSKRSHSSIEGRKAPHEIGKHMHCVLFRLKANARKPKPKPAENIVAVTYINDLKDFKSLDMTKYRRKLWLSALRQAGVDWAQ